MSNDQGDPIWLQSAGLASFAQEHRGVANGGGKTDLSQKRKQQEDKHEQDKQQQQSRQSSSNGVSADTDGTVSFCSNGGSSEMPRKRKGAAAVAVATAETLAPITDRQTTDVSGGKREEVEVSRERGGILICCLA